MASISELINNNPAAKAGVIVVAVALVAGVAFMYLRSAGPSGYGNQVSTQTGISEAQKAIAAIKSSSTIPEKMKATEIQYYQAQIDKAEGKGTVSAPGGPPKP